jgi:hypothetical protein
MKYTLKKPVQFGEKLIADLTMREEICAGDVRGIKLGALGDPSTMPAEDMMRLIGRLSGLTDGEIAKLGLQDLAALSNAVLDFFSLGSSPKAASSDSTTSAAPSGS